MNTHTLKHLTGKTNTSSQWIYNSHDAWRKINFHCHSKWRLRASRNLKARIDATGRCPQLFSASASRDPARCARVSNSIS